MRVVTLSRFVLDEVEICTHKKTAYIYIYMPSHSDDRISQRDAKRKKIGESSLTLFNMR